MKQPRNYLQWFLRYLYALPYDEARGTLKAASAGLDAHYSMTDQGVPPDPDADDAPDADAMDGPATGDPLFAESEAMQ